MKKIQFNYDLWVNNKEKYDLVTRDGDPAKVYQHDPDNHQKHVLIGSVNGTATAWDVDGWFYEKGEESSNDLMMIEKKQTKNYKYIVVAVRYPKSGLFNVEVCPLEDKEAIESNPIKEGFDYQIKEIEFEF